MKNSYEFNCYDLFTPKYNNNRKIITLKLNFHEIISSYNALLI